MKRFRIIFCAVLLCVVFAFTFFIANAASNPYDISEGAVIFNSSTKAGWFSSVNSATVSYDDTTNSARFLMNGGDDARGFLNIASRAPLSANEYKYIVFTYMVPTSTSASSVTTGTQLFLCADSVTGANANYVHNMTAARDGTFHSIIIDLSAASWWKNSINGLRLDPFQTSANGDSMYVDSIIFTKTSSEALSAKTYRESKANGLSNDTYYQLLFNSPSSVNVLSVHGESTVALGDVNTDGKINMKDCLILRKHLANFTVTINLDAADVYEDGTVNSQDALYLRMNMCGLYPLGSTVTSNNGEVRYDSANGAAALTATKTAASGITANFNIASLEKSASQYKYIVLVYKVPETVSADASAATMYPYSGSMTAADDGFSTQITLTKTGRYVSRTIDLSASSQWVGAINGIDLEFFNSAAAGDTMYIDSLTFCETSASASNVASYRTAVANNMSLIYDEEFDVSAQTLSAINSAATYKNIGFWNNNVLQPFSTVWPAAGYTAAMNTDTLLCFMCWNNYIKAADTIDLSKYSAVTITYGTDRGFTDYTTELGFFSSATEFGNSGTKNTSNLIFSSVLSATTAGGWTTTRSVTTAINSSYSGPLYLSLYMPASNGIVITDITFTLKEPVLEQEPDPLNNFAGTPAYTVSANGSYIYANGATYPNNFTFTSGVTVATGDNGVSAETDNVKRTLTATSSYDFEEKNVGIFYFLWLGHHGNHGAQDISKIYASYNKSNLALDGTVTYSQISSGQSSKTYIKRTDAAWTKAPDNSMYFWGEPLYGYYYNTDQWVIRRHIDELTAANIDFIYFDVTNGPIYETSVRAVMEVLHEYNLMGYDAPQIVFYTNTNSAATVQTIYNTFYASNYYPDTWFYYEGKPVIICNITECRNSLSSTINNFFTMRNAQWPDATLKTDAWSWMDFTWPQRANSTSAGVAESINVSIAQHNGSLCFSDCALYGSNITNWSFWIGSSGKMNRGRNYRYNASTGVGYNDTDSGALKYGYNFEQQWDRAISVDVPVVLVTGWNEWVAGKLDSATSVACGRAADALMFVDTASPEYSRDAEMMRGGYFDNYYIQLVDRIRDYKGSAPLLVQNTRKRIDVSGSFSQWNDILVTYRDATTDTINRNHTCFGTAATGSTTGAGTAVNTTGRNNFLASKIVYDTEYAYFYVQTNDAISAHNTSSTWMQLFVDVDSSNQGWYTYDYVINYQAQSDTLTSIASLAEGTNRALTATTEHTDVEYKVSGKQMMIKVPLSYLGITDYNDININFKWADSTTQITTMEQMYTDGDTMPHGRLNYVFTNTAS